MKPKTLEEVLRHRGYWLILIVLFTIILSVIVGEDAWFIVIFVGFFLWPILVSETISDWMKMPLFFENMLIAFFYACKLGFVFFIIFLKRMDKLLLYYFSALVIIILILIFSGCSNPDLNW